MLAILALFLGLASAHSWVEQLTVIAANGTFVGEPGYARGNVLRSTAGFNDNLMVNLLPPNGRSGGIQASDAMCKTTQQTQSQTAGSPRLQAAAGASIALRYQENGHVTLPQNQPGKPANRGTMYVYGTTQPRENDTLLAIHKVWNANGTGGDQRGVLLSTEAFDDGRCYQINGGNISVARQAEFPHTATQLMGADIWCQQDLALPANAPSGQPYTLYWVWDWPTAAGVDPNLPEGKAEIYTTCMDVDIIATSSVSQKKVSKASFVNDQNINFAAIPAQFDKLRPVALSQPNGYNSTGSSTVTSSPSAATGLSASPATITETVTEVESVTVYVTMTSTTVTSTVTSLVRRSQVPIAEAQTSLSSTATVSSSPSTETPSTLVVVTRTAFVPPPEATSTSTVTIHVAPSSTNGASTFEAPSSSASSFRIRGSSHL